MNNERRYELKYVLDNAREADAMNWLYCHTTAQKKFVGRQINSLYFDDVGYQSVRDNLAGISDRKKIRLRWYHGAECHKASIPSLEIKVREGRLGHKHKFPLPVLQHSLESLELQDIVVKVRKELAERPESAPILDDYLVPTLQVSYFREYYEDFEGMRITIDSDIKFHGVSPHRRLGEMLATPYPLKTMEIKFDPAMKDKVANLIRPMHITPKRHSKYLVGLAMLGQAVYL